MAFQKSPLIEKTKLILDAFGRHGVRSFLDLGGCWGVSGAYTFQSLLAFDIERAVIIDADVTAQVKQRATAFPQLELMQGSFDSSDLIDRLGKVDAIIMYDILLHQVAPDWDELIALYAPHTNLFVIYNQMWTGSEHTLRLFDLGLEEYAANTPYGSGSSYLEGRMAELKARWDDIDPATGRKHQDQHNFWQWGIVVPDLMRVMWSHGFKAELMKDYGSFHGLKHFENNGFVFSRTNGFLY